MYGCYLYYINIPEPFFVEIIPAGCRVVALVRYVYAVYVVRTVLVQWSFLEVLYDLQKITKK